MNKQLKNNIERVRSAISDAAKKSGRTAEEVKLVAVSKRFPIELVREAYQLGVRNFGENRVQEAIEKIEQFQPQDLNWHLIGHLQTNKINKVIGKFALIQSIDSYKLAEELNKRLEKRALKSEILLEVYTAEEESKFGFKPDELDDEISRIQQLKQLRIRGLMTIATFEPNEKVVRDCFIRLRELYERLQKHETEQFQMKILSMGMSSDYQWAIEEGANLVRIGTAIFGQRNY